MSDRAIATVRRAYKGFRAVIWDGRDLYLKSPTYEALWYPQADGTWRLRARCNKRAACSRPPSKGCRCGVYASYDNIEAIKYSRIIGLLRPVGRTIPAQDGWRAEAAVVELLAVPEYIRPELPPVIRDRVCTYDLLYREQSIPLPTAAESRSFRSRLQVVEAEEPDDFHPPAGVGLACYGGVFYVSAWLGARSYTRTYCGGSLYCEEWQYNGQPHREGGPARALYWPDGRAVSWAWFRHGEMYREDGPPIVVDPDGAAIGIWLRKEESNADR